MNETEAVLYLINALETMRAEYAISGSFASNFWGEPRSTRDIDIIFRPETLDVSELGQKVSSAFELDTQMRFEGITGTSRYVLVDRRTGFQAELFLLTDDPFDQSRFARRTQAELSGVRAIFLTAEDVIVQKLLWLQRSGDQKHNEDVRKTMAVQYAGLDWDYIRRWTEEHGTGGLLDKILKSIEKKASGG